MIILILYFFIIIILFYSLNNYLIEKYQNYVNPFYKDKSFCTYDNDEEKCKCTYQKDSINIPYKSPETSCNNKCINKNKENCNKEIKDKLFYYCKKGNKCIKHEGTILNKYISNNNCGYDKLTNLLILPYLDQESCEKSINSCDKYNEINNKDKRKEECLNNTNCGYCTNNFKQSKCIEGTAEGPLDLNNKCSPNNKENKYEYGKLTFL